MPLSLEKSITKCFLGIITEERGELLVAVGWLESVSLCALFYVVV